MNFPKIFKTNKTGSKLIGSHAVGQSLAHRIARDPYMDWILIFGVALIVSIILAVCGVYKYVSTEALLSKSVGQSKPPAAIDTKALTQVLNKFDDRANERASLLHGYTGTSDPSI